MGQIQQYKCPKCAYQTTVNGGIGYGMFTVVVTITCRECARLYDVVADQSAAELFGDGTGKNAPTGLACPQDAAHHFEIWQAGGPCPKCGTTMAGDGAELCWD